MILYHSNEYDVVMVYTYYRVSYFYADNVSHLQSRRDALFTSTLSWFRVSYLHADNVSHPLPTPLENVTIRVMFYS